MTTAKIFFLIYITIFMNNCVSKKSQKVLIDLINARPIRTVPKEFLGVELDALLPRNKWDGIKWGKATILTRELSPAYLRFGGTSADYLLFVNNSTNKGQRNSAQVIGQKVRHPMVYMTASDVYLLIAFARMANLKIIFELNSLQRTGDGQWDWKTNVASLLTYLQAQQMHVHFELGNEPDLYPGLFNLSVDPEQLAQDYNTLGMLTKEKFPFFNTSKIVGPAVAGLSPGGRSYVQKFLQYGGADKLDALTIHHYYFNGRTATSKQFLDPAVFDHLADVIKIGKNLIKLYLPQKPDFPLWLGETSSGYNRGAPGLSDRFIASFIWLDKLGLSPLVGVDTIIRQDLFGGHYGLLDNNTDPNPDYWLTVLYKRLVGPTVLNINTTTSPSANNKYARFYAHCNKNRVTVFGMNLGNESLTVTLKTSQTSAPITRYLLTAPNEDLLSQGILLNNAELLFDGVIMPPLDGVQSTNVILMPPKSLGFFVVEQNIVGCSH